MRNAPQVEMRRTRGGGESDWTGWRDESSLGRVAPGRQGGSMAVKGSRLSVSGRYYLEILSRGPRRYSASNHQIKVLAKLGFRDVWTSGMQNVNNHLAAGQQSVGDELARPDGDRC